MTNLKRGLCASLAALSVTALASTASAQPDSDVGSPVSGPQDADENPPPEEPEAQSTQGEPAPAPAPAPPPPPAPAPAPEAEPEDTTTPPAGDAAHDPRPEASNAPAPGEPAPRTDARTWSEGNVGTDRHRERSDELALSDMGFALSAGGGVDGFIDDSARDFTNDGGAWDVRAVLGTRSMLGLEVSYIGSAQSIDALGLDDDALLVGNGAQGALRLNLAVDSTVTPFVYGGAAWRHYTLSTDTNTSDILDSDDVLELPLGAGVAFRYAGLIIDARGELRASLYDDLMPLTNATNGEDEASMNRWGVKANIGYEF